MANINLNITLNDMRAKKTTSVDDGTLILSQGQQTVHYNALVAGMRETKSEGLVAPAIGVQQGRTSYTSSAGNEGLANHSCKDLDDAADDMPSPLDIALGRCSSSAPTLPQRKSQPKKMPKAKAKVPKSLEAGKSKSSEESGKHKPVMDEFCEHAGTTNIFRGGTGLCRYLMCRVCQEHLCFSDRRDPVQLWKYLLVGLIAHPDARKMSIEQRTL